MTFNSAFDKAVLSNIAPSSKRTSFCGSPTKFEDIVFTTLVNKVANVQVQRISDDSYLIRGDNLSSSKVAKFLSLDNEIEFSEDYLDVDESLIRKSVNPLWVVKAHGNNTVRIQRVF